MLERHDFVWAWKRNGWSMVLLAPLWLPLLLVVGLPKLALNIVADLLE